jgi:hypothetical protein
MRILMIAAAVAAAIAAVFTYMWLSGRPDASWFAELSTPRLTHLPSQRMLVVEAVGDPNTVAGGAFKLLFATYYKLPGVLRMQKPPAPRARWASPLETPRREWKGRYALPLPAGIETLLTAPESDGLRVGIETWEYGDVAELLHAGPYSREEPDIRQLLAFIASRGYRAIGDHEEEYVRGPGMIFAGDPEKYLTIIRLRVAVAEPLDE